MFIGQHEHNVDAKGRIILPVKFRELLSDEFVIARGLDGCLAVYGMDKWNVMASKLAALPSTKKMARDYARLVLSSAAIVSFDKMGRINLPSNLIKIASITKKCILIGVGEHIEIWDEDKWNEYNGSIETSFEDIAEELIDFEI